MSTPAGRKKATSTPKTATKRRARGNGDSTPSTTRSAKRSRGSAHMNQELESQQPHSTVGGKQPGKEAVRSAMALIDVEAAQENRDSQSLVVGSHSESNGHPQYPEFTRNPLTHNMQPAQSQVSSSRTPTVKPKHVMSKEELSTRPEKKNAKITLAKLFQVIQDKDEDPLPQYDVLAPVFYPPEYQEDSPWLGVDLEEITGLDDQVHLDYFGSHNWKISGEPQVGINGIETETSPLSVEETDTEREQSTDVVIPLTEGGGDETATPESDCIVGPHDMEGEHHIKTEEDQHRFGAENTNRKIEQPSAQATAQVKTEDGSLVDGEREEETGEERAKWEARVNCTEGHLLQYCGHSVNGGRGVEMSDSEWNAGMREIESFYSAESAEYE